MGLIEESAVKQARTSSPPAKQSSSSSSQVHVASMLLSLGIFIAVGSSVLSAFGFKGRQHSIGIDLGTTFSVVAVKQNGTVRVVPDEFGRFTTPSVVSYTLYGDRKTTDNPLVGHDAVPFLEIDPKRTIYNAKRFIGRTTNDSIVLQEAALHPFDIVSTLESDREGVAGPVMFDVGGDGDEERARRRISPEDVGSHILRRLRRVVNHYLGHDRATTTVVAVPADFRTSQKKATRRAFLAAGFSVARIIDEPTAAAVAYGLHRKPDVRHVLVYDLGGGTLDCSLLHIHEGSVQVILEDGDNHLGGEDFDQAILRILDERIGNRDEESDPRVSSSSTTTTTESRRPSVTSSCSSHASRKALSERTKRNLSERTVVEISCTLDDATQFRTTITRREFEASAGALFDRAIEPVKRVLEYASMRPEEIDEIVMVGGSSRIPKIRESISAFFGGMALRTSIDPDLAVAIGAASIVD